MQGSDIYFFAFGALVALWFAYRYLPAHAWFYARLNGIRITIPEFTRLSMRTGDPMAIFSALLAARAEGIGDLTVGDLEEVKLLAGDLKPFIHGLIALRKSEFRHLTTAQAKAVFMASGSSFKDLIVRTKRREEIFAPKFILLTADGSCVAAAARVTYQMELSKLLAGSRYTSEELLRRHIEKTARAVTWDTPDPTSLVAQKEALEAAAALKLAEMAGVLVHEFRFTRFADTGRKMARSGLSEELFDKLRDEVLLDREIALDREIDDERIKRRKRQ